MLLGPIREVIGAGFKTPLLVPSVLRRDALEVGEVALADSMFFIAINGQPRQVLAICACANRDSPSPK